MEWWWYLIIYVVYVIFSFALFIWSWNRNGKTGGNKWYDYLWVPGVMPIAALFGFIGHLFEKKN